MNSFLEWLAVSPLGGAAKAASGAVLVWVLDNVQSLNLPAVVQVAVIAALPVIINYLNPADTRYPGKGTNEADS
jgi:hypothetical protein